MESHYLTGRRIFLDYYLTPEEKIWKEIIIPVNRKFHGPLIFLMDKKIQEKLDLIFNLNYELLIPICLF